MAVKKAALVKAATTKVSVSKPIVKVSTAKKAALKKFAAKKVSRNGQSLVCGVCGLSVTIDEDCGCVEMHDIICCGKPMKEKKPRTKARVKAA